MRGHIADSYNFDLNRWAETWREFQEATATPADSADAAEAEETSPVAI
jgi:hypothetical protein